MGTRFIPLSLLTAIWLTGCSSISMPSIPWPTSGPTADPTAEALYEEGTRYLAEKRYVRAIDVLTKLKNEHPFSPQLTDAELKIADAYYLNEQYPEAINAFKEFQSMHPTNENIPFVLYRLGQAHLDQFTATDRDQKNTEIAKGYFENVIQNYPKSPYAIEAREKLGKAVGYLAEHDFNIATFYLQQEKYPAARERFEEIVRKYRGTPVAARSLFFLGESYRKEKNNVKAGLAYEALIQHYPESKFALEAKTHLAQLEKEKQDPLAMLLMRDRRPAAAPAAVESAQQTAGSAKLKDFDNVVAKTEIVYEEPGDEKGILRRVVDKINPFGSSDDGKKKPESATDVAAKKKASEKQEPRGIVASLWDGVNPFGGQDGKTPEAKPTGKNDQLVNQIDDSLQQKGINSQTQTAALKPPSAELAKVDQAAPPPQTMDTSKLLGDIDDNLKKSGKAVSDIPAPPEAAPVFRDTAVAEAVAAQTKASPEPQPSAMSTDLLSSIDQKLKSQGLEPAKFEAPPAPSQVEETAKQEQAKKIELEPKVAVEKGPLFLPSTEMRIQEKPPAIEESTGPGKQPEPAQTQQAPTGNQEFPRALVQGPAQPQPAAKTAEQRKPLPGQEEEKGIFDQLKTDMDNVGKILNPLRW